MSDVKKGEADYSYNGMGKRVAVVRPDEKIEYLLDLTKDYHNMLERSVNGETETYTYDASVVSMSKRGEDYFYMLDELGSGMYLTGTDGASVSTYAYDEFGRNIDPFTGKLKNKEAKHRYKVEGNIIQPLAFTGYQNDEMTDNYFAQARYYNSEAGRFVSEDKIRGFIDSPETINHYLYCWDNPTKLIDLDGNAPILVTTPIITGPNVYNDYIEGYNDALQRYDEECEKNKAGKSLSELQKELKDNPNMPDYTDEIDKWVKKQEDYFDVKNRLRYTGIIPYGDMYYDFYQHVKTNGPMDIKQQQVWKEAFGPDLPYGGYFLYHGQVMDAATLGNVVYAYVGAKYFSEFEIYSGGAAVQVKRYHWQDLKYMYLLPYWGDMDEDYEAISLGIKWRKEGFSCDE